MNKLSWNGTRNLSFPAKGFWLIIAVCAMLNVESAMAAGTMAARTIVSLTFDDGLNESPVAAILRSHGMNATFYVNSNLIDQGSGYLTKAELDELMADGNEIGGHTFDHVDLATLSDAEQQAAICNDMQLLDSWYPGKIHSFAYPFASTGPSTQSIVAAGCPGVGTYTSARSVGGLVSGAQCGGCATSETIPPGNPYYISSPESILSTTSLDAIKTLVTQAEDNGGGWVPLVFHQVCSNNCSDYSITEANLDAFLTWLQAREANYTYVRTVNQVMIGDIPPPPPPPPLGPNQLNNASLEIDSDANNVADCWERDAWGTNSATWTRTNDAYDGVFAEQLDVTAYSSGDLKLLQTLDGGQASGGCAPNLEPNASYQLAAWYKSTSPVVPVLFYLDSAGNWQYWRDGPLLPVTSDWSQMSFMVIGPPPAGAQALSFGLAIESVGTITTDSYSLKKVLDGPVTPDTSAPTVSMTAPLTGTVSGSVTLSADASDNVGVVGVQFKLDGVDLGVEDSTAPYSISWNSVAVSNGAHTLSAVARDAAGNTSTANGVVVNVNNVDSLAPTVSMTAPSTGTVSGLVAISADASDNVGVVGVQFKLDGADLGSEDTSAPYTMSWDSASASNGTHMLSAVARDAAGNTATANDLVVNVDNSDSLAPTVSITVPLSGAVSGLVTISADASDNVGVAGVQFLLDGANLGSEDTSAPYTMSWDSSSASNGTHTLSAVARDAAGNTGSASNVIVTVDNTDSLAPTVSMTAPLAGTVSGSITLSADASDNVGVAGVQFLLDGANLGVEDTSAPYTMSWDSSSVSNGVHSLSAVARDAAGNTATASAISITVNNAGQVVNLLNNPSLEVDSNNDGIPDCWIRGGYGTNGTIWSRVGNAHDGNYALSLQITSYSSGDRKLIPALDAGTCAPAVTAGASYEISTWYQSTAATGFVLYYRDSSGNWQYWTTGPDLAASANWTQATYTTPTLPAGATHISFGLYLSGVGTLTTDDYAMQQLP